MDEREDAKRDWRHRTRVVLLPGLDGSGRLFRPWLEVMPATLRRHVIAYPPDRPMGYDALTPWVAERIEGEADEPVVLVGESFGGPLALRVAAAMPGRVKAVVLVATFGRSPMWPWLCWTLAVPVRWLPTARWLLRWVLGDRTTSAELVDLVCEAVAWSERRVLAQRVREVAGVRSDDFVRRLSVPVMYVQAQRDCLVGPASLARLQRLRPDLHAVRFDTPHTVLQHQPDATWTAVAGWLDALKIDWEA